MVPLIAILFLSVKAMLWLWTWNTASRDTEMSWNWLLPHNVFTILFCLFSHWEDNLPAFSKSTAVTSFTFPGMIIRNHHLLNAGFVLGKNVKACMSSRSPRASQFFRDKETKTPRGWLSKHRFHGPRRGRKVTGTSGKHLHITKTVKAF